MADHDNPVPKCARCGATVAGDAPDGLCPRCLVALNFVTETEIPGEDGGPAGTHAVKAAAPPAPTPGEIAQHFPQFEILECLGRGGMGAVYKARQPKLDRCVALKILLRRREDGSADAAFAERFAREARALARLNHPNIVAVYDYGEAGGHPFLVMEYVEGLTLRQLLQRGKLAPAEALAIVPSICDALQFAHQNGIVHRDIKPENILLDKTGQVKITDFGIAKIIAPGAPDHSLTGAKDVVGTPHYMAPEQVEQPQRVDHRADIYSLGVVFYEMLTGELPLGKFQPPSNKVQIDVRLDEVVLRALAKEPERRYQQASQVKTAVETIAGNPLATSSAAAKPSDDRFVVFNFQSKLAIKVMALTGLAGLGALGQVPGWEPFYGFFGFFGCIGLGFLIESIHRKKNRTTPPTGTASNTSQPHLWKRLQTRLWPPMVGVRQGQRVINRPALMMQALRSLFAVLLASVAGGILFTVAPQPYRGVAVSFALSMFLGGCGGICIVLTIYILRGFALPLEMLPELDGSTATSGGQTAGRPMPPSAPNLPPRLCPAALMGASMVWFLPFSLLLTTSLGWAAVMQIRRSAGRLCGLGLAVFDGLLFPLLALDALIVGLPIAVWLWLGFKPGDMEAVNLDRKLLFLLTIVVALAIAAAVDNYIIRRVWRAVNKPRDDSFSAAVDEEKSTGQIRSAQPASNQQSDSLHGSSPPNALHFSRTAIVGAVWALLFAVSWVWNYTPPGWRITHALRDAVGNWAVGLMQGPLALVAFAAPVAVTVLGGRAVNGIRRSQGRLRGLALALADAILFPLLLVDFWLVWLCQRVDAAISGTSQTGAGGAIVGGAILGLVLDAILIAWLWRRIQKPLPRLPAIPSSADEPADPERSWRKLIRKSVARAALIGAVHLCLLETILQAAVPRPESTGELWSMALFSGSLAAMAWAAWPLRRTRFPIVAVVGGTLGLFAVLSGIDSLYSLRVRPNLGLYEEDEWVSQHPGFQWGWRKGIANALWEKPLAQPFAPAVEMIIPLGDDLPATLIDLDTGRQANRNRFDIDDEQTLAWVRAEKLDLALVWKTKRVVVLSLGLGVGWVPHFVPREELTSQAAVNFWLLDRKPAKECSDLQVHTNLSGTFVFRTREGGVGLLELAGWSDNPRGVRIRYTLVPQTPVLVADSTNRVSAIARTTQAVVQQQVETKLSAMKSRLRLTEDQERAMRALLEKKLGLAGELSTKMTEGGLSKEEMEKADRVMRDLDQQLKETLTPEQWTGYEALQVEERLTQAHLAANVEVMELQPVLQLSQTQRDQVLQRLTRLHERQLVNTCEGLKIPVDWEQQLTDIKDALRPVLAAEQVQSLEKWLDKQRAAINTMISNGSQGTTTKTNLSK